MKYLVLCQMHGFDVYRNKKELGSFKSRESEMRSAKYRWL